MEPLAGSGVGEGQPPGVEHKPTHRFPGPAAPVNLIAEERVSKVFHVHPDLVGSAGVEVA